MQVSLPCVLALGLLASLQVARGSPTPGKLDSVDVDMVLKNQRLFDNYVKCVMDKAPCSAEGTELKERLPKDIASNCKDCTDNEKARAKKVIMYLQTKRKDVWEELKKKYDPENKWKDEELVKWLN